ncbi:MAG: hypothetical protein P4L10_05615 [Acidobacteriaceae bacterium]|nr:hypothetical protein [Acidobacteriaceae bacterium]
MHSFQHELSRRDLLRLSATGAAALGANLAFPALAAAAPAHSAPLHPAQGSALYSTLLQHWCDGLLAHQITTISDPALHGAFLCPACGILHGRCADAVYPLLRVAHTTGNPKYLRAALQVHAWSELNLSRDDGSWANDITLSSWKGITVFRTIALAEALQHHGSLLNAATRRQWTDRLSRAAKFLDGFITIETGNINYPITSSLAFALCGQVLGDAHYTERAHDMAHQALAYFTPNNLLFGEGHPQRSVTPKGCRPVDLGYNVEESLPALALYALLTNDAPVLNQAVAALRSHLEFMLPDGGWDNSWGTRNYKWSYWGSRTADGCHPAYVLLAAHDPAFREAAQRNLELMAACTHDGLLYGGPDYFHHGDRACIHHTFTHAKALATVLDRGQAQLAVTQRTKLPRDAAYGLKTYPEIATHLAAIGDWRATVTGYDFNYVEEVQTNGSTKGGHVSGGALSFLYHCDAGPLLTASMTEYSMIEISNQQAFLDKPHMSLTPRIEYVSGTNTYTSVNDFAAQTLAKASPTSIAFDADGRMLTASRQSVSSEEVRYHLSYFLYASIVDITATAGAAHNFDGLLRFILPVISRTGEVIERPSDHTISIRKPKGTVVVSIDAPHGFEPVPEARTFNLVPGFECVPLAIAMQPGKELRIRLKVLPA